MLIFVIFSFIYSDPYVTEDELKLMLRVAESSGAIEEEEQVIYNIKCLAYHMRLAVLAIISMLLDFLKLYLPLRLLYLMHFGLTNCQEPCGLVNILKKHV